MAAQAQCGHAQERAHHQRNASAKRERNPEVEMEVGRPETDGIGTKAEEGSLRQVDLAAQAKHDGQTEDRDRIAGRLHQDVHHVIGQGQQPYRRHGQRRQRYVSQRAGKSSRRQRRSHSDYAFSATRSPKIPCGRKIRNPTSTRNAKPSL